MAIDQDLVNRLAALEKEESNKQIAAMNLHLADETLLKAHVNAKRELAAHPPASAGNEALGATGTAAGVAAVALVERVQQLLKGETISYHGWLSAVELVGRLRTKLGGNYRIPRLSDGNGEISIYVAATGEQLAEVLLSYDGGSLTEACTTHVSISRASTDKVRSAAGSIADQAMRQAVRPGGFGLGSLLDLGQKAVKAAVATATNLSEMNAVVSVIEDYGAEVEQAVQAARRKTKADDEAAKQREYLKTHCGSCSTQFPEGTLTCPKCGAPVQ